MKSFYYHLILTLFFMSLFSCATYKKFDYAVIDSPQSLEGIYYNHKYAISEGFHLWDKSQEKHLTEDDIFKMEFLDEKTLNISYLNNDGWRLLRKCKGKYNTKKNTFDVWNSRYVVPLLIFNKYSFDKVRLGKDEEGNLVVNNAYDNMGILFPLGGVGDRNSFIRKPPLVVDLLLIPVRRDDKWGYAAESGEELIQARFDSVTVFRGDIAGVKLDGKWGYLNRAGEMLIAPRFDSISTFKNERSLVKLENRWGCVNNSGQVIVEPAYDGLKVTNNKILYVQENNKWGVLDSIGNMLIPCKYEKIDTKPYYDFYSYVYSENKKVGLLSPEGVEVIPPVYDKIELEHYFSTEQRLAIIHLNKKKGITMGEKILCPPIFSFVTFNLDGIHLPSKDNFHPIASVVLDKDVYTVDEDGYMYKLKTSLKKMLKYVVDFDSKIHYSELIKE